MPIYDISGATKPHHEERSSHSEEKTETISSFAAKAPAKDLTKERGNFLSSLFSRLFFAALLILDLAWGAYSLFLLSIGWIGSIISFGRGDSLNRMKAKAWLSFKRSLACGLALIAAIFSPAFGIMIACTYFLMYDKSGIEEVIPASLQDSFRDFFKPI